MTDRDFIKNGALLGWVALATSILPHKLGILGSSAFFWLGTLSTSFTGLFILGLFLEKSNQTTKKNRILKEIKTMWDRHRDKESVLKLTSSIICYSIIKNQLLIQRSDLVHCGALPEYEQFAKEKLVELELLIKTASPDDKESVQQHLQNSLFLNTMNMTEEVIPLLEKYGIPWMAMVEPPVASVSQHALATETKLVQDIEDAACALETDTKIPQAKI